MEVFVDDHDGSQVIVLVKEEGAGTETDTSLVRILLVAISVDTIPPDHDFQLVFGKESADILKGSSVSD